MKKLNKATKNMLVGLMGLVVFLAVGTGVIKMVGGFSKAQAATGCIITLFGKQYDVTALQNAHTGGNLFACGTDMTATYQAQHGTDVSRMISYLVPDPTSTPIVTPAPTDIPTPTDTPLPTVTPVPTNIPSPTVSPTSTSVETHHYEDEDEDEAAEEEQDSSNVNIMEDDQNEAEGESDDDDNDDNNGHHLVGANSAHGTMDNTFKKERED